VRESPTRRFFAQVFTPSTSTATRGSQRAYLQQAEPGKRRAARVQEPGVHDALFPPEDDVHFHVPARHLAGRLAKSPRRTLPEVDQVYSRSPAAHRLDADLHHGHAGVRDALDGQDLGSGPARCQERVRTQASMRASANLEDPRTRLKNAGQTPGWADAPADLCLLVRFALGLLAP
jgi:hypothetical protein